MPSSTSAPASPAPIGLPSSRTWTRRSLPGAPQGQGLIVIPRDRHANQMAIADDAVGRIEVYPARAGQIDLAPGMQIGEIDRRTGGTVERNQVGLELDQIA